VAAFAPPPESDITQDHLLEWKTLTTKCLPNSHLNNMCLMLK